MEVEFVCLMIFPLYGCTVPLRWQRQDSTTVAQFKLLIGSVVLSAIKTWKDGNPRTILGESIHYFIMGMRIVTTTVGSGY